jgi:hypothetical protein
MVRTSNQTRHAQPLLSGARDDERGTIRESFDFAYAAGVEHIENLLYLRIGQDMVLFTDL